MKCVFCNKQFSIQMMAADHIVPKFLGGRILLKNVCKNCNNMMEHLFEKTISETLVIKLVLEHYGINGRKKHAVSPWMNQTVETDGGVPVVLSEEATPKHSTPALVAISEDGSLNIRVVQEPRADSNMQSRRIYESIPKNIIQQRKLRKGPTVSLIEEKLRSCSPACVNSVNTTIDITALQKLFIKVAYETSAVLFGWDWVCHSVQAKRFHDILLSDCGGIFGDIEFSSARTMQCNLLHAAFPVLGNPQEMFVQLLGIPTTVHVVENEYLPRMHWNPIDLSFTDICIDGTRIPCPSPQQMVEVQE